MESFKLNLSDIYLEQYVQNLYNFDKLIYYYLRKKKKKKTFTNKQQKNAIPSNHKTLKIAEYRFLSMSTSIYKEDPFHT